MKNKLASILLVLIFTSCGSESSKKQSEEKQSKPTTKFTLKASNMQYVAFAPDYSLVANQPDPGKAVVFEKIDLENGKCHIKGSNEKYVCDDRSKNSMLYANRDNTGEWETFEIISVDNILVHIKSSKGMFISSDRSKGDTLFANRPEAGEWERFSLIPQ